MATALTALAAAVSEAEAEVTTRQAALDADPTNATLIEARTLAEGVFDSTVAAHRKIRKLPA